MTSYMDRATFLGATSAASASGPPSSVSLAMILKLGSVTIGITPGGDNGCS